jgi:hypothetical protein
LENVQRNKIKKERERENLQDIKWAQTRCQNLSLSKTNCLYQVGHISPCQKPTAFSGVA